MLLRFFRSRVRCFLMRDVSLRGVLGVSCSGRRVSLPLCLGDA